MNKTEFRNGAMGESIGMILGAIWFTICLPYILIKWIFSRKSLYDITESIFNTKIGKSIREFDY